MKSVKEKTKQDFTGIGIYKQSGERNYTGEYVNGKEHGVGVYQSRMHYNPETDSYEPCHIYAGQFNNDSVEGIGIKLYNNFNKEKEIYCGEYKKNKRNGIGYTKFVTGGIFIGEHKNHTIDGFGIFITWEGLKFIGQCYENGPTAIGKWYDKDDNEIDIIKLGYDKHGCKYKREIKIWPCGEKYTGTMHNGKAHGLGTRIFNNGNMYTGFWKNGKMEGQGNMTWAQGSETYVGKWKNGKMHGHGTHTSLDGRTFTGEFKEGNEYNT